MSRRVWRHCQDETRQLKNPRKVFHIVIKKVSDVNTLISLFTISIYNKYANSLTISIRKYCIVILLGRDEQENVTITLAACTLCKQSRNCWFLVIILSCHTFARLVQASKTGLEFAFCPRKWSLFYITFPVLGFVSVLTEFG